MVKPYLSEDDRFEMKHDTLKGSFIRLDFEVKKYKRTLYRKYWIFGYIIFRYDIQQTILNPMNEEIKRNWR